MQNPDFGLKIEIKKKCQSPFYKLFRVAICKKPLEKTLNNGEIRPVWKSAIMQRLQPMQNPDFGSKSKIPEKHAKIHSTNNLKWFCAKNRCKNYSIFQKWDHFVKRPSCKGYSSWKILTLGQKLNSKKHVKIHSTTHLKWFCAKNRCKKH